MSHRSISIFHSVYQLEFGIICWMKDVFSLCIYLDACVNQREMSDVKNIHVSCGRRNVKKKKKTFQTQKFNQMNKTNKTMERSEYERWYEIKFARNGIDTVCSEHRAQLDIEHWCMYVIRNYYFMFNVCTYSISTTAYYKIE